MDNPVEKYFTSLSNDKKDKLSSLESIYSDWNSRINLVSRKDMDDFVLHHVIHSLSISRIIKFRPGTRILDAGTGGGFPGIPLAVVFPDTSFTLVDSIRKKVNAVEDIRQKLDLQNVKTMWSRIEDIKDSFDFILSRAVAPFPDLLKWTRKLIKRQSNNKLPNGIIALKGGTLEEELINYPQCQVFNIRDFFNEEYFREKKIIYMEV